MVFAIELNGNRLRVERRRQELMARGSTDADIAETFANLARVPQSG
jgi:hypothetical protein